MASSISELVDENSANKDYGVAEETSVARLPILVAIVAYNEEVAIGSIAARCKKYSDTVVVVDDGSDDQTVEVARLVGADVISHEANRGYGAAIMTCFEAARKLDSGILVILDGDGQHDPDDIPLLVAEMKKTSADIIIGSKFVNGNGKRQHIPIYRKFGMKVLDRAVSFSSGIQVSDSQSGFRAYSNRAINEIDLENTGMGAGAEILIKAADKQLKIVEVPIMMRYDIRDTSSKNPVVHGFDVIFSIFRLTSQRRPLIFFVLPGLMSASLGLYLIFTSPSVFHPGTMGVAMLFIMAGTLCVFTGLMLRAIQHMGVRPGAGS